MHQFVARENIDHYLRLLNSTGLGPEKRATVTKLLIEELDKLRGDFEQLGFAERRAADGRDRLHHLRSRLDLTPERHRAEAERVVANVEATQHLLEDFCHQLRNKVNNHY
jgi:hypothetical protein